MPPPSYMPPPPPPKSSTGKIIMITCGVLLGLGLLACGGCSLIGWMIARKVQETAEAWANFQKTVEAHVSGNKYVVERLGKVKSVRIGQTRPDGTDTMPGKMPFAVNGEKDNGVVNVEFDVQNLKPVLKKCWLYHKGKQIDLDTGEETTAEAPPVKPESNDPDKEKGKDE
jgi:hypothetical protein